MCSRRTILIFAICALILFVHETRSAEISFQPPLTQRGNEDRVFDGIGIEGVIEAGDFEKFETIVQAVGGLVNSVALASPGGDVIEAMKIGRLIREMRYETRAPVRIHPTSENILSFGIEDSSNNICTSSCFFIYIAGMYRVGNIVGIHRPYLSSQTYEKMGIDDAIDASLFLKDMVVGYFDEMGVPTEYADRAFMISSQDIEWLSLAEIDKKFSGYIPEVAEWISAQCPSFTDIEKSLYDSWGEGGNLAAPQRGKLFDKFVTIEGCKSNVLARMSCKAWEKKYWEEYKQFPNNLCDGRDFGN